MRERLIYDGEVVPQGNYQVALLKKIKKNEIDWQKYSRDEDARGERAKRSYR